MAKEKPVPLNLRIPPTLKRNFHVLCIQRGSNITAELVRLMQDELERHAARSAPKGKK